MSLESEGLEGLDGKPGCNYVTRARVGSDGVSTGLPDASGEIIALRVWLAVPVHDELMVE